MAVILYYAYIHINILLKYIYIFRGNSLRRIKINNSNNSGQSNLDTTGIHHRNWCNKDSMHLDRKYMNSNITATIVATTINSTVTVTTTATANLLTTITSASNNSINRLSANLTSVELSPALIAQANWTFVEKLLKVS